LRPGVPATGWQERRLGDGSRHRVFKRYLTPADLERELGAEVLHGGAWFVAGVVNGPETRHERARPTG
jgi:hypothetical protein